VQIAETLRRERIACDAHNHLSIGLAARRERGKRATFSESYAPLLRQGGIGAVQVVVGGDAPRSIFHKMDPWWGTLQLMDMLWQEADESDDSMAICTSIDEIDRARSEDKIAVILSVEGGTPFAASPISETMADLRLLHRLGVRSFEPIRTLWPSFVSADKDATVSRGLTDYGCAYVQEAHRLGMLIDLAHIPAGDRIAPQIVGLVDAPVIDSHSGVLAVSIEDSNGLDDERIDLIASTGGVVGLSFSAALIKTREYESRTPISDLVTHVDYIVERVGVDHVALGSDYVELDAFGWEDKVDEIFVDGMESPANLPRLTAALLDHGYGESDVRKILGENMMRVWRSVLG
jgi:membrane dipeptidase